MNRVSLKQIVLFLNKEKSVIFWPNCYAIYKKILANFVQGK
jgi:hypothetical protein